jgi:glycerate-2-kinase
MSIQNFEELAKTPLRRQALTIAESALSALQPEKALSKVLSLQKKQIIVEGKAYDLEEGGRVILVGFGKAALEAARGVYKILGEKISCGFVLDVREGEVGENIVCKVGTHPSPTVVNVSATSEILQMLQGLSSKDLIICIVSGGGSSLFCSPWKETCDVQSRIEKELTMSGADIVELNTVRKHLSTVKGGQLAVHCRPARLVSLVFSDVPHGKLSDVASGPTMLDESTVFDAKSILDKYDILKKVGLPTIELKETPKDEKLFSHTQNVLVVSGESALLGATEKARELGFDVRVWNKSFTGEAHVIGSQAVKHVGVGECLLGSGESTVFMSGESVGQGGRNQELALGALLNIFPEQVLVALASDGFDNTEFAGAIVDTKTLDEAGRLSLSPKDFLMSHDSYNFFKQVGDGLLTGKTGFNVSDIIISVRQKL